MLPFNNGKLRYKLTTMVAAMVLKRGIIFGGYVRDIILHNHHSQEFYKKCSNAGEAFDNKDVFPEHADRCLIPRDIDCFMPSDSVAPLIAELQSNTDLVVRIKNITEVSPYIAFSGLNLYHTVLHINLKHNNMYKALLSPDLLNVYVKVDILHTADFRRGREPPFGNIDFECNALIMESCGALRLSEPLCQHLHLVGRPLEQLRALNSIIESIVKKEARPCEKVSLIRGLKLAWRGWTVFDTPGEVRNVILSKGVETSDNVCVICLDNIGEQVQVKGVCCESRYHAMCFRKMVAHEKFNGCCPGCRREYKTGVINWW